MIEIGNNLKDLIETFLLAIMVSYMIYNMHKSI